MADERLTIQSSSHVARSRQRMVGHMAMEKGNVKPFTSAA